MKRIIFGIVVIILTWYLGEMVVAPGDSGNGEELISYASPDGYRISYPQGYNFEVNETGDVLIGSEEQGVIVMILTHELHSENLSDIDIARAEEEFMKKLDERYLIDELGLGMEITSLVKDNINGMKAAKVSFRLTNEGGSSEAVIYLSGGRMYLAVYAEDGRAAPLVRSSLKPVIYSLNKDGNI